MLDLLLRGGTVIDGTGAPGVRADVGVRDGRVVEVGDLAAEADGAATVVDADGLVIVPGFVDPHTHYDAQLFWDPTASPSNVHGVTTVIGGNCGFTLAPLDPDDADYLRRMMAKVEGMPLEALEHGIEWTWRDFGEYLERVAGRGLGVNAGFLVGHCALRRRVMGTDSVGGAATPEQVDEMRGLLADLARGRRARLLDLAGVHALRRRRRAGAVAPRGTPTRSSRSARRSRTTRAPRSRRSPTGASTASRPRRWTCSPGCRRRRSAR